MKKSWEKPKLVVSKCLNKEKCRYDGTDCVCKALDDLSEFIEIIGVCPEVEIGLKIPRECIRIVGDESIQRLVNPKTNEDLTDCMLEYSNKIINSLEKEDIDGFILKGRSPSCGIKDVKIYASAEKGSMSIKGKGIFAKCIIEKFPMINIEEEGRLKNFEIRDNFFIKIFTLADYKKVKTFNDLLKFHTKNKLLFMTYSPHKTKLLGNIIASENKDNIDIIIKAYKAILDELLQQKQKFNRCNHIFEKAYGYVSDFLYQEEKEFFREILKEYKDGKQAKKTIITLLKGYAIRFNNKYLLEQTILEPYPEQLLCLDDSGKGIVRSK